MNHPPPLPGGPGSELIPALLLRAAQNVCALPLGEVVEVMRPLATRPLAETPPYVLGLAVIRGDATPVLDLGWLLGGDATPTLTRYVSLRSARRPLALAVEKVLGIGELAIEALQAYPTLLGGEGAQRVRALGTQDEDLLLLLNAARLVPDSLWQTLRAAEET